MKTEPAQKSMDQPDCMFAPLFQYRMIRLMLVVWRHFMYISTWNIKAIRIFLIAIVLTTVVYFLIMSRAVREDVNNKPLNIPNPQSGVKEIVPLRSRLGDGQNDNGVGPRVASMVASRRSSLNKLDGMLAMDTGLAEAAKDPKIKARMDSFRMELGMGKPNVEERKRS